MHAGVGTNRDSRRIAGYRSMTGGVRTTTATVHRPIYKGVGFRGAGGRSVVGDNKSLYTEELRLKPIFKYRQ